MNQRKRRTTKKKTRKLGKKEEKDIQAVKYQEFRDISVKLAYRERISLRESKGTFERK
jgi:hypothetical protein